MVDRAFCDRLEYAISNALSASDEVDLRRCWCDGILLPDNETDYSSAQILKEKEMVLKAWIDEGRIKGEQRGQFLYDMRLSFGDNSLRSLKTGDRLEECIPDSKADLWIVLERENRTIEVTLI